MTKKPTALLLIAICLGLSGCSGEPSASDVTKAVGDSFKQDTSLITGKKLIGAMVTAAGVEGVTLESVDKIGCEPSGKNAYLCEVSVEYTINTAEGSLADIFGAAGHKRSIGKYRFVNTSKGWIVAPGESL